MIKSEITNINGKQYRRTYSDSGYYIERDGMQFSEAVDFLGADFVYTETNIKIEDDTEQNTNIESRLTAVEKSSEVTAEALEELIEIVLGGEE
ncbi:MAG: hypothetical protein VZR27_08930 [Acutalibacteraceae bacterium]|nr:hypothetical protein [Acutalibacteraceae bacterium]